MTLTRFIKPYAGQFTLASVAKMAEAFLELYLPFLMKNILNVAIPTQNTKMIWSIGAELIIFSIIGFFCAILCQYYASVVSQSVGTDIRNALMQKISSFSYQELDSFGTSSLINRLTSDVNNYQQMTAMTMRLVTRAPFLCIGAIILSIMIDPVLSLIFVVLIPILGFIMYLVMSKTAPRLQNAQKKLDRFALTVREYLSGVRVIRAFAKTDIEYEKTKSAATDVSDGYIAVGNISSTMQPITSFVLNIGVILLLYFGAQKVFDGRIENGDILALSTYATKILYSLIVISNLTNLMTKSNASSKRICEVLETVPSIQDNKNSSSVHPILEAPCVEFKNVSFSYNDLGEDAVQNINFSAKTGQTMGIVGITGSGKTTLVNLIERFYDVKKGEILLLGNNVKDYSQEELRNLIGLVPQKNILFSGTVADNIRMGKQDATDEEVIAALKTAQCWEFVSELPDTINSDLYEGGKNLSGGQMQRLTIARAIVRRPRILIMDDSLSALDYKTDLMLRQSLKNDLKDMTILIVSQRISSVHAAQKIVVMDHGNIVGFGNHEELMKSCETYQEIYESQTEQSIVAHAGGKNNE